MRIKMNHDIDVDESSESPEKCQRLEWNFNSLIIHSSIKEFVNLCLLAESERGK